MTALPDHLPTAPPAGLPFWRDQWAWITKSLNLIYDSTRTVTSSGAQAELALLGIIKSDLEHIMTQEDELTAAVAANTAAADALTAGMGPLTDAVTAEIADVKRLTDLLAAGPAPSAAVAQAISDVQASTAALEAASAGVSADTSALAADDPAAPAV